MKMTKKHLAQTPLLLRVVSVYVGVFLAGWGIHTFEFDFSVPQIVATRNQTQTQVIKATSQGDNMSMPAILRIDAVHIDLEVRPGTYGHTANTWTPWSDTVQFATMTARPNRQSGTTLLYSHDTWRIMKKVRMLEPGDVAIVTTSDNRKFRYRYTSSSATLPSGTVILSKPTKKSRLVLLTCGGWQNERRELHYFELLPATKRKESKSV